MAIDDAAALTAILLADTSSAPSVDLAKVIEETGRPPLASAVRGFIGGIGTSALRFPALLAEPETTKDGESGDDMPELFCPGPLRDDPALGKEVNDRLVAWAEEVGIYPGRLDRKSVV